ncbi:hypothetical protein [Vampirovibrio chlorellavorus]|uniref:hypothetical protein n=1 Tax=Vampirovibrio chlorellavorus TaxID=758823 RepID=UPI0026EA9E19|nr:hypothetical protein [Vampirovibrio chlorellavorus]
MPFFIIFLLISTIPALVFVLFPNAASNINSGDIPSFNQSASKNSTETQEVQTPDYLLRWRSQPSPLKAGQTSRLTLNILSRASGSPWEGQLSAVFIRRSKLASDSQPIPASVETTGQSGVYHIEAQLPQAGPWDLQLTLTKQQAPVVIKLYVAES